MPVAPSFTDLLAQFQAEAQAVQPALQFNDGDMATAQMHGAGAMGDASIKYAAQAFKATFIDGAEGDDLTVLVDDHLNIQRNPATAASVDVTFTRTGNATGTTPVGFTIASAYDAAGNTIYFTTNTAITWGASDHGPHIVTCTASDDGSDGDVAAGTVTRLIDTPFDSTIAITNASAAAGGNDAETDQQLRVRARNFWVTLRRGTLAALEQGALSVPEVRVAAASENLSTGVVTLVVSDENGNSTAQMISDTETEIEDWRVAGVTVNIYGGTQLLVNVTGTATYAANSGADPLVYGPLMVAAISARMDKYKQGETMYLDSLKAAVIAVDPDVIDAFTITVPGGDTTPTTYQTIRPGVVLAS